jgi:ADP-heptose:LPS heptosyltransferase
MGQEQLMAKVGKRALVIRIGRLGDTILATPIIQALRQSCGTDVVIDFAVAAGAGAAILGLDRRVSRVFGFRHCGVPWPLHPAKRALRKHSQHAPYDLVFNLECGQRCDDFVDFVQAREYFGRPRFFPGHLPGRHCVDTEKTVYADVLGAGVAAAAVPSLEPVSAAPKSALAVPKGCVILNPGFSGLRKRGYRSHRGWPTSCWRDLIDLLTGAGHCVAINGHAEERDLFRSLAERPGVLSLFGASLTELVAAMAGANCVISVDTGTMHLAAALGVPVVALFGPTDPQLTGPYPGRAPGRVLTSGIDCQPCFRTSLQKRCRSNRCMQELSPRRVFDEFERMIGKSQPR